MWVVNNKINSPDNRKKRTFKNPEIGYVRGGSSKSSRR